MLDIFIKFRKFVWIHIIIGLFISIKIFINGLKYFYHFSCLKHHILPIMYWYMCKNNKINIRINKIKRKLDLLAYKSIARKWILPVIILMFNIYLLLVVVQNILTYIFIIVFLFEAYFYIPKTICKIQSLSLSLHNIFYK